jgi:hypothetical protein
MAENNNSQQESFFSRYKWYILIIGGLILFRLFSGNEQNSNNTDQYESNEVIEPTEGVVTTLQEVDTNTFKITNEEVVPTVEESRIVANYMDGGVDTFTLQEIKMIDTTVTSNDNGHRRRSGISRVVHYGLIGYMLGRPWGSPIRSSSYATRQSYDKAQTGRTRVNSSATRRTVTTPRRTTTGKSGYGAGRSTKSYGG